MKSGQKQVNEAGYQHWVVVVNILFEAENWNSLGRKLIFNPWGTFYTAVGCIDVSLQQLHILDISATGSFSEYICWNTYVLICVFVRGGEEGGLPF